MTDTSVFLSVGVALIAALVLGEVVDRAGEPVILGEILAGIALGTYMLGVIDPDGAFALLASIGAMLLLFDAGYEEIDLGKLEQSGASVVVVALLGVGVPAVAGFATGVVFGYDPTASAVLAIAFGVTSIGVSARMLFDVDRLHTQYALHIVGVAALAEVVGLTAFSLLVTQQAGASLFQYVRILALVAAFFAGVFVVYRLLIGRFARMLGGSNQPNSELIGIMGLLFLFGYAADAVGLDAILGGLVAGLIVGTDRRFRRAQIREGIVGIAYGVFIPLFFVSVGARLDPSALLQFDPFVATVVTAGVGAKVGGGYLGGRLVGHDHADALIVGIGLLPRAGAELIVATSALAAGIIDQRLFVAVLALVLVSVLTAPLLLTRAIRRADAST
ncbi:cation:proton antiporter [Natrialba chahannaoensis]|uniref:cation:proton antiporter n=1 Tax=Natrialba chahannaoensis TaxID=68911 RepID=UPI001375F79F|nr:cation:proton antiporter [Natrialba chahannaoensis]